VRILDLTKRIEDLISNGLDMGPQTRLFLDEELGPHPTSDADGDLSGDSEFTDLYGAATDELIDQVVAARGAAQEARCSRLRQDPRSPTSSATPAIRVWVDVPEQPKEIDALAEDEAPAAESQAPASAASDGAPGAASVADLIARGEGARVEFKQTARINLATKQRDPAIELMVVKSIAGFMNAPGGTLLIGVADRGDVFGTEKKDLKTSGAVESGRIRAVADRAPRQLGRTDGHLAGNHSL
jgi:hypothetical protein